MAVASAEPYASYLHFAPEDNHAGTSSVIFLVADALPDTQPKRQSTEGHKVFSDNYKKFSAKSRNE